MGDEFTGYSNDRLERERRERELDRLDQDRKPGEKSWRQRREDEEASERVRNHGLI